MGLTGLIFALIAAAWLVYLVPYFLHHRGDHALDDGVNPAIPFTPSVTIVRSGSSLAEADPGSAAVSTPLTRKAQLRELSMLHAQAAQRRRRVLVFLLAAQLAVAVLAVFGIGAWWGALIPVGLILTFLVVARFSVRTMNADLAKRAEEIRECPDEETVAISLSAEDVAGHEHSIELSVPIAPVSLRDPVPITRPTYVSKPLAPRTVRTIDLSAPVPGRMPVTADPIRTEEAAEPETEEGVG